MKRLLYDDIEVLICLRRAEDGAKKTSMDYNREFIDYHNDICPCCQKAMKIERHSNTVKNVGFFGLGVYTSIKLVVPYVICKSCVRNIPKIKASIDKTENYILEKLGLINAFR